MSSALKISVGLKKQITIMLKRFFLLASMILLGGYAFSQNLQTHYDFGRLMYDEKGGTEGRQIFTTTVEMFRPDSWGSTFFFVDMDYGTRVQGAYWEIAREICFWQNSKANWLSAHIEYNGGMNLGAGSFNNAFLVGATYSGHSEDFSKTWSVSVMYKAIPGTTYMGKADPHSFQITGVWGLNFFDNWLTFSGFIDFWKEARPWQVGKFNAETGTFAKPNGTRFILLSEPQLWVNLNKIPGWDNVHLSLGGEVELSNNFVSNGFYAIPTFAAKWTF